MTGQKSTLNTIILLIFPLIVTGQEGKSDYYTGQVKNNIINEQIFLSTDRNDYIAGEVLWFSSWLTDSQSSHFSSHSTIARIEILNSNNIQVARSTIKLKNGRGYGQVRLSDTLNSGKYKIRAYTNWMRNFIPDEWFQKDINIFNNYKVNPTHFDTDTIRSARVPVNDPTSDSAICVIVDDTVSTRERVSVELQIRNLNGEPELSASVVPFKSVHCTDISQRKPNRKAIKPEVFDHFQYKNEDNSYFISGKLMSKTGKPSPAGKTVYFSVPGRVPVLKYARTDESGRFSFKIGLDEKIDEFILQPDTAAIGYQIIMESSFFEDTLSTLLPHKSNQISIPHYITEMSVNSQIAKAYSSSAFGNEVETLRIYREPLSFYGKAAKEVSVEDFIQLDNMKEIFFEIIPGVSLIKTDGRDEIQMKNSLGKILYETPPLMMIDGIIIWDPSILGRMDPEEIGKIDVVQDQYMVGECLFNGIVNVITKTADFRNVPLPRGALRIKNTIFDSVYEFAAPQHSRESEMADHEPDYRNTLYWNPDLQKDPEGKLKFQFWTSDVTGCYSICIQGFTSSGTPVSEYKLIHVTN